MAPFILSWVHFSSTPIIAEFLFVKTLISSSLLPSLYSANFAYPSLIMFSFAYCVIHLAVWLWIGNNVLGGCISEIYCPLSGWDQQHASRLISILRLGFHLFSLQSLLFAVTFTVTVTTKDDQYPRPPVPSSVYSYTVMSHSHNDTKRNVW